MRERRDGLSSGTGGARRRHVPTPSQPRPLVVYSIALLLGMVTAVVTLEVALRVGARGWSRSAFGPWEERRPWEAIRRPGPDGLPRPVPGGVAAWRIQPWHQPIEYRLDSHGFRTGGMASPSASRCRVLALGDSHTFGYGVTGDEAWPAVLETRFAHLTVVNAGLCGSGIAAEQAWLPAAMADANPRVVILAVTPWSLRDDPEPPEEHLIDPRWPRLDGYLRRVTRYSAVADRVSRIVFQRLTALAGWPPPASVLWELGPLSEPPQAFHARWRGMHARLAQMVRAVRVRGATPLVLFIPLDLQVSAARNVLYRTGRLPYLTHGFVDRDYTHDDRYVRALAKTAVRLRIAFVDATPALQEDSRANFLADDYHLAPLGHARIAALMAEPIADACAEVPSATLTRAASPPSRERTAARSLRPVAAPPPRARGGAVAASAPTADRRRPPPPPAA